MKRVKLFKVVIEDLLVHENLEHVNLHNIPFEITEPVAGTHGEEIACLASYKTFTIPIRKHFRRTRLNPEYVRMCGGEHLEEDFTTEETYIAIDPAAERVLDVELSRIKNLESEVTDISGQLCQLGRQNQDYVSRMLKVIGTPFLTRLKWLFTGVQDV